MKNKSNISLSLRKVLLSALVVAPLATLPAPLWALPVNPHGTPGSTNVTFPSTTTFFQAGSVLQITDTLTNRLVLKWTEFGTGDLTTGVSGGSSPILSTDTIIWTLPSAASAVLNMVTTGGTLVNGTLQSNGAIFIVNPNGITLSSTAKVNAPGGFGLSTATENEFTFLATGALSLSGLSTAAGDVSVAAALAGTTRGIDVGTTGNVMLAGRMVQVSGDINAGTLTINSNNVSLPIPPLPAPPPAAPGVVLASTSALTVGTAGVAATGTSDQIPGTGNVVINSNGGGVTLSGAASSTIRGGQLTVNTAGGSVGQGAGAVVIGGGLATSTQALTINAGAGAVTLPNLDVTGSGNDRQLDITVTAAGNTTLTVADRVRLMSSTISGNLILTSTDEHVLSGGASTVTGAVTLSAATAGKDVTFNSAGDLTFPLAPAAAITVHTSNASSDVTLISGGSITLPNISLGGNLTVTAATNITQQAGSTILQPTSNRRAKFESTSGGIVVNNATNDFTRVQLVGAPLGVTLGDMDDVTIFAGTNVTGPATINAPTIILGAEASDVITFNNSLTLNGTASATVSLSLTSGGTLYTTAPTFTLSSGGGGTTTLSVTLGTTSVPITNPGAGYTTAPTVTFDPTAVGAGAAASASLRLDPVAITGGTGYVVGDTFTFLGGGSTIPAVVSVATVDGLGAITGTTLQNAGAGYTTTAGLTVVPITTAGVGAVVPPQTGNVAAINVTSGGSLYTTTPTVTLAGGGAPTTPAVAGQATGSVEAVTLTTQPTIFNPAPAVIFSSGTAIATATATAPVGGGVSDNSNNVTVTGLTQINSLGPVVIDGAFNGIGLNHNFGQINVNQGAATNGVTLYEMTTLNLGVITSGGKLRAYSASGEVVDTGPITVASAEFGAGTAAAPGNITIDSAGTTITGPIAFLDDVALVTNSAANSGSVIGSYLANNVSITTAGGITLARVLSDATGLGIPGTLTLSATGALSDVVLGAETAVAGLLTINAANNVTATNGDNVFGTATITAGGNVSIRSDGPFTVNATLTQNTPGRTALFRSDGALAIGTINSNYTGTVTFQAGGNNSITDNVNGMRVFGPVNFTAAQNIVINNTGHSFGLVSASTTDRNGSITIVESGGLRLGTIATHGRGSFTATSTTGDIFQDVNYAGIRLTNGEVNVATFSAPLGNIILNDNDRNRSGDPLLPDLNNAGVNAMPIINATAGGNIVINNPRLGIAGQTVLGNITAGGSLTVDNASFVNTGVAAATPAIGTTPALGAPAVGNIEQSSSGRVNAFGVVTLVTSGSGAITLGNSGNRFGGIIANADTGNITLTEVPTLNLLSVETTGTLVATSTTGSIIDTPFTTGVYLNSLGNTAAAPNATFSAPSGNVTLGLAGSNFGTVGFTTGGNVSILDSTGNTTLAASTIGGTLDVNNTAAAGVIGQSGPLLVTGNVTLITNLGGVSLSDMGNQFGGIRFSVGASGALIGENTTLNLRGGSTSTGPVQLVTNGDFITSGAGASSITNTMTIQAQGTIIPGAGSLLVTQTFTVFSPSLKDLSALSKSGNLLNQDPVNLGAGAYVPPSL